MMNEKEKVPVKRILWIVNGPPPEVGEALGLRTSASGTWFVSLLQAIRKAPEIELAVATVYGSTYHDTVVNGVRYFIFPGSGKRMLFYDEGLTRYWEKVEEAFHPDVVHVYGTEFSHSLSYLRRYPEKKVAVTLQGIIGKIAPVRAGGISFKEALFCRTWRDNLHLNGILEQNLLMKKNVKYEREILQRANCIVGRTDFDQFYAQFVNPNAPYFRNYFSLSPEFYEAAPWNISEADKYTIYGGSCLGATFKGGHIFLRALARLKSVCPQIKAKVIFPAKNGVMQVRSGYNLYNSRIIKKYQLQDNLIFLPRLSSEQVACEMRSCRVCVVPSAMENGSTTLREAMQLGVPSVASFRGGMTELLRDRVSGFYYDYPDSDVLAGRILQIMNDDDLSLRLSENAKIAAQTWHDRDRNLESLLEVYRWAFSH